MKYWILISKMCVSFNGGNFFNIYQYHHGSKLEDVKSFRSNIEISDFFSTIGFDLPYVFYILRFSFLSNFKCYDDNIFQNDKICVWRKNSRWHLRNKRRSLQQHSTSSEIQHSRIPRFDIFYNITSAFS